MTTAVIAHTGLKQLVLWDVELGVLKADSLKALKVCNGLESLQIKVIAIESDISDGEIADVVQHLPRLEDLSLHLKGGTTPQLTLSTLLTALRHCPDISYVSLWIDATSAKIPSEVQSQHQKLETLSFSFGIEEGGADGLSPIDSAEAVAAFLSPLSAKEMQISFHDGLGERSQTRKLWGRVDRLLPAFQKAVASALAAVPSVVAD